MEQQKLSSGLRKQALEGVVEDGQRARDCLVDEQSGVHMAVISKKSLYYMSG